MHKIIIETHDFYLQTCLQNILQPILFLVKSLDAENTQACSFKEGKSW